MNPFQTYPVYIKDLTTSQLHEEYKHWAWEVISASNWGGSLGAAAEFRKDCGRELELRFYRLPTDEEIRNEAKSRTANPSRPSDSSEAVETLPRGSAAAQIDKYGYVGPQAPKAV